MYKIIEDLDYIVVLALDYESPFDNVLKLRQDLMQYDNRPIIFDLLLCNGICDGRFRYAKCYEDLDNVQIIDEVPRRIKDILYIYYKRNPEIVNESILPNSHKYIILNGIL